MLSQFAIGLAILIDQQPSWSIEVPWYFHKLARQECYDYQHYDIEKVKIRKTNVENIHFTYFYSKLLYVNIPSTQTDPVSAVWFKIQKKRKAKLRLEIQTEQVLVTGDGKKICLKTRRPKNE